MARRQPTLLEQIERGALDESSDLTALLRKCVALGGQAGSTSLRDWATRELKGYTGDGDDLPGYRTAAAPLLLDGQTMTHRVRGQVVAASLIPEFAREHVSSDIEFRQPIGEIADLRRAARADPEGVARLAPPGMDLLLPLINSELGSGMHVERIFWAISSTTLGRVLDVVRTSLVELVAEMRAGTPADQPLPSSDVADQAVQVVVKGVGNRVSYVRVNSAGDITTTMGGTTSVGGGQAESRSRRVWWWVFGMAGLLGAAATVVALL